MGQRFFSIGKVPVFLEKMSLGVERRKNQEAETKVATLTCSVAPFSAKHANAIDNGAKTEYSIRNTIFDQTGDAKPVAGFDGHSFTLNIKRQDFEMFLTPDSDGASIMLDHVKIKGSCTVKVHNDNPNSMVLTFKAAVGPLSPKELSEIQKWFRTQRFITFRESDPSMDFEEVGEGDDPDDDAEVTEEQPELPAAEFETDGNGRPIEEPANRPLLSHAKGRKKAGHPTTH